MKTLGIDIGTTTISAAVLEDGQFLASETRANGAFIPSALTCAREQDVEKITQIALSVIETLFERYPDIHSIGVTGQMHGILSVSYTHLVLVRARPGQLQQTQVFGLRQLGFTRFAENNRSRAKLLCGRVFAVRCV